MIFLSFLSAIHGRDRMKELKPLIPHVTDFVMSRLSHEKYIKSIGPDVGITLEDFLQI